MNTSQVEAVANANAHLNNVALPTYDELVAALEVLTVQAGEAHRRFEHGLHATRQEGLIESILLGRDVIQRATQELFLVVDKSGRFYAKAGEGDYCRDDYTDWTRYEDRAEKYDKLSAQACARGHVGAMVLPASE